jgi:ferritin
MLSKKMTDALNTHTNAELYSSYLYLSMSSYASHQGLRGAANWLYVQANEEMIHVQKMYDYVNSQGARVILDAIEKPPAEFGSLMDLFQGVLEHEQKVTALINELMTKAVAENDHATQTFLQWFVTEQIEEEETVNELIARLRLAGDTGAAVFMIDNELAARVLVPPTA